MRYLITLLFCCAFVLPDVFAQDDKKCLSAICRVSEIEAGVPFEVQYAYEASNSVQFIPPDFEAAGFRVVGASQNSNMTWTGATMRSVVRYAYQLIGERPGPALIPPAVVSGGDVRCESESISLNVLPYPEGKAPVPAPIRPKSKTPTIRL
ncbi:MAG: BatD family protein [Saprospiraceae bacterium]